LQPFLQFGEVQWWYFPNDGLGTNFSGMPFYDASNQSQFEALYGHPMAVITGNTVDPADYPDEVAYLAGVIGNFTSAVISYVRGSQSSCRFEVLYPTDVNQTAFNRAINYPAAAWTPALLTCLKTEAFGFTFGRDLDKSEATLDFGGTLGFPATQRAHLVESGCNGWVAQGNGDGLGQAVRKRGAVRARSVLLNRLRAPLAEKSASKCPDRRLINWGLLQVQNEGELQGHMRLQRCRLRCGPRGWTAGYSSITTAAIRWRTESCNSRRTRR